MSATGGFGPAHQKSRSEIETSAPDAGGYVQWSAGSPKISLGD